MDTSFITPTILIVDDEPYARQRLRNLLNDIKPVFEHCIVAEASSATEALQKIEDYNPDLIFIDINMPGESGLSLANKVNTSRTEIIFLTAREDCALDAYNLNAVDYLLKPLKAERLGIACSKARLSLIHKKEMPELTIVDKGIIKKIPLTDIYYFMADIKYTTIKTEHIEYLTTESLVSLEEAYSEWFIRVHRGTLVAKKHIKQLIKSENDNETVWYIDLDALNLRLPVSRRQLAQVKKFLKL